LVTFQGSYLASNGKSGDSYFVWDWGRHGTGRVRARVGDAK